MPTDYCCEHAGGVMRNGACIVDPEDLLQHSVRPGQVVGVFEPAQPTKVPPRVVADMPVSVAAP